jgi:hypothetical protein
VTAERFGQLALPIALLVCVVGLCAMGLWAVARPCQEPLPPTRAQCVEVMRGKP